ncbi:MAG: hypothetical protein CMM48_17720 [Rhodospirillaceae bacterium]|nr:hypothetical protein [Rhodospirillaceae bacterium]HAA93994.1 hypothetical protein [Rhodospirillaceae bacterium]|tara:strand:+ start:333 stop:1295 length:963 start_codon:yes stop_codon:yes gene_type:complete
MARADNVIDMEPGDFFDPFEFTVTPELNQQYCFAEGDFDPRYVTGECDSAPMAHPGFMLNMSNATKSPSHAMKEGYTSLQAGEENTFLGPMYVGEKFKVTWQIVDKIEDHGRLFRFTEAKVLDDKGEVRLHRHVKSGAYSKALADDRKKKEKSGEKPKRPPLLVDEAHREAMREGSPKIAKSAEVGDVFCGPPKHITFERLTTFSGGPLSNAPNWPKPNQHTDYAYAKERGLPTICASATQYQGHLVALMIDMFGMDFLTTGKLDFKLIKTVLDLDTVSPAFVITSKEEGGDGTTYGIDVWTHNQDWQKVLIGGGSFTIR